MKNIFKIVCCVAGSILLSSCSVYMASQKNGATPEEIKQCRTKACIVEKGAVLISQKANKNDVIIEETYTVQKPTGSTGRAVAHGALSVATLGAWEGVGTMVEQNKSKPNRYLITVIYLPDGNTIKGIYFS